VYVYDDDAVYCSFPEANGATLFIPSSRYICAYVNACMHAIEVRTLPKGILSLFLKEDNKQHHHRRLLFSSRSKWSYALYTFR